MNVCGLGEVIRRNCAVGKPWNENLGWLKGFGKQGFVIGFERNFTSKWFHRVGQALHVPVLLAWEQLQYCNATKDEEDAQRRVATRTSVCGDDDAGWGTFSWLGFTHGYLVHRLCVNRPFIVLNNDSPSHLWHSVIV